MKKLIICIFITICLYNGGLLKAQEVDFESKYPTKPTPEWKALTDDQQYALFRTVFINYSKMEYAYDNMVKLNDLNEKRIKELEKTIEDLIKLKNEQINYNEKIAEFEKSFRLEYEKKLKSLKLSNDIWKYSFIGATSISVSLLAALIIQNAVWAYLGRFK